MYRPHALFIDRGCEAFRRIRPFARFSDSRREQSQSAVVWVRYALRGGVAINSLAEQLARLPAFALQGVKKLTNGAICEDLDGLLAMEGALALASSGRPEVNVQLSSLSNGRQAP